MNHIVFKCLVFNQDETKDYSNLGISPDTSYSVGSCLITESELQRVVRVVSVTGVDDFPDVCNIIISQSPYNDEIQNIIGKPEDVFNKISTKLKIWREEKIKQVQDSLQNTNNPFNIVPLNSKNLPFNSTSTLTQSKDNLDFKIISLDDFIEELSNDEKVKETSKETSKEVPKENPKEVSKEIIQVKDNESSTVLKNSDEIAEEILSIIEEELVFQLGEKIYNKFNELFPDYLRSNEEVLKIIKNVSDKINNLIIVE